MIAGGSLLGAAVLAAGASYLGPHLLKHSQVRALRDACRRTRSLVLTYDDGPGPTLTRRLLALLDRRGARATFFLLGTRAASASAIVEQVVAAGHEVACHSHAHLHAWRVAPWSAVRDIRLGYRTLARWVPPDGPFRPPYGKLTAFTWIALRARGVRPSWWTIDSGDTRPVPPSPEAICERLRQDGGGVVLMHDFDRTHDREARAEYVLRTTDLLLATAAREGLRVRTFRDLTLHGRLAA